MTWTRLEDSFPHHPKIRRVSVEFRWWMVAALSYCNRYLTDGFIGEADLGAIEPAVRKPRAAAEALADQGLLHRAGETCTGVKCPASSTPARNGGWTFHDFWEYQPTAVGVKERREADRERKRLNDSGKIPPGIRPEISRRGNLVPQEFQPESEAPRASPPPQTRPVPSRKTESHLEQTPGTDTPAESPLQAIKRRQEEVLSWFLKQHGWATYSDKTYHSEADHALSLARTALPDELLQHELIGIWTRTDSADRPSSLRYFLEDVNAAGATWEKHHRQTNGKSEPIAAILARVGGVKSSGGSDPVPHASNTQTPAGSTQGGSGLRQRPEDVRNPDPEPLQLAEGEVF